MTSLPVPKCFVCQTDDNEAEEIERVPVRLADIHLCDDCARLVAANPDCFRIIELE